MQPFQEVANMPGGNSLTFERTDGPFGVIVHGIDWDNPGEDEVMLLKQAFRRHLLVIFRGQPSPSYEQKDRFFSRFGRVMTETFDGTFHYEMFSRDEKAAIHRKTDGNYLVNGADGTSELIWHTDHFHKPQLKTISVLEALEFEKGAAPTQYRDSYTAYELLPADLRQRLEHKQAVYFDPRLPGPEVQPRMCDAMHPVFMTHPESGRHCLYIMDYTKRIVGMSLAESDALIAELRAFAEKYAPFYSHDWEAGDLIMWDNIGLHHMRPEVRGNSARRILRQYEGVAEL